MIPSFHDGELTGVVLGDKTATLHLRHTGGSPAVLALAGLERLQMADFRQGNIIFELKILTGQTPTATAAFDRLFPPPDASHQEAHRDFVSGQLARIERSELVLVTITSSYGADLIALCREAIFER